MEHGLALRVAPDELLCRLRGVEDTLCRGPGERERAGVVADGVALGLHGRGEAGVRMLPQALQHDPQAVAVGAHTALGEGLAEISGSEGVLGVAAAADDLDAVVQRLVAPGCHFAGHGNQVERCLRSCDGGEQQGKGERRTGRHASTVHGGFPAFRAKALGVLRSVPQASFRAGGSMPSVGVAAAS